MNTTHTEQVQAMRQQVKAALVALGWAGLDSTALAEKSFATVVGPKVAHVYLQDFGAQSQAFILAGAYWSEGRNILEGCGILIQKEAQSAEVSALVQKFIAGVEAAVGASYAVRLMRAPLAA
jgi:hypothetical protein